MATDHAYTDMHIKLFIGMRLWVLPRGFLTNNEELAVRASCRVSTRTVAGYYDDTRRACQDRARAGCPEAQALLRSFNTDW